MEAGFDDVFVYTHGVPAVFAIGGFNKHAGFGSGAGGGVLLNSIQSQYPGPANLAQEDGALALDEMELNWGYHGIVGFRYMREKSFYYVELRPTFHNFQYESGLNLLKEHDQFVLQSFQIQLGVGKNIF